jgi:hypothetical protein
MGSLVCTLRCPPNTLMFWRREQHKHSLHSFEFWLKVMQCGGEKEEARQRRARFYMKCENACRPSNGHVSVFEKPKEGERMLVIVVFFFGVTKS